MGTDWISDHRCSFDLCAAALTGLEFNILLINIGVRTEVETVEQRGARAFWNVDMPIAWFLAEQRVRERRLIPVSAGAVIWNKPCAGYFGGKF